MYLSKPVVSPIISILSRVFSGNTRAIIPHTVQNQDGITYDEFSHKAWVMMVHDLATYAQKCQNICGNISPAIPFTSRTLTIRVRDRSFSWCPSLFMVVPHRCRTNSFLKTKCSVRFSGSDALLTQLNRFRHA